MNMSSLNWPLHKQQKAETPNMAENQSIMKIPQEESFFTFSRRQNATKGFM